MKNRRIIIKTLYYIEQEGSFLELSISELHNLIEQKTVFGNTWVFDSGSEQWMPLNELTIFKKFDLSFNYSEKTTDKPEKNPIKAKKDYSINHDVKQLEQGFFQDYVSLFQKQFDNLLEKNLNLVNENMQLKIQTNEMKSDNEISKIETKSMLAKLEKEKYLVELKLSDAKEYVDDLLVETEILRDSSSKLNKDTNTKLDRYTKEIKHLNDDLDKKVSYIDELTNEVSGLTDENEVLTEDVLAANEKIDELKIYNEKYEDEIIQKIEEVKESHESEVRELHGRIEELSNGNENKINDVISKKNETINKLLSQNELIKNKFKEESVVVKKTFENYKQTIICEKEKNKELNVVILAEKRKALKLESLIAQQELIEMKAPRAASRAASGNKGQLKRKQKEIGKLFEINNENIWEIKGDKSNSLHTFLEIKDLILKKEITDSTFIRKKSKWWKKVAKYSDFKIDYFTKEVEGETKVYIERKSMRAPVNFSVSFNTLNSDFAGKCLNLSEGGCFLEVKQFNQHDLKQDEEINLTLKEEGLSFSIKAKITELVPEDKGLGIQFLEISSKNKEAIKKYIDQFLYDLDQAA